MNDKKYEDIFNVDLIKRFVSDNKLPIPLFNESWEDFKHFLLLYEEEYKSYSKWKELYDLIQKKYNGKVSDFLKDFYERREAVIQWLQNNPAQKKFIEMDMTPYTISNRPQVSSKSIYNGAGANKIFISVDLKKANFQAMKYVDTNLVNNSQTYEDFISLFADYDYFRNSKHLRQVIFGQSCPKRQITVESFLIHEIWLRWKSCMPYLNLVSLSNDEFVVEIGNETDTTFPVFEQLRDFELLIKREMNLEVKVQSFLLKMKQLYTNQNNKPVQTFFIKNYANGLSELVCLPLNYRAIVTKLLKGLKPDELDFHFSYEGYNCRFCEEFYIK